MILDEAPAAVTIELPPLPEAWVARLGAILEPAALGPAFASFALEKPTCLRANELKATADQVASELAHQEFDLEPLGWCPGAWWIPAGQKRRLTDSDAFQQGRIYVQNPSSLLPPLVLAPVPGEEVLDLAAAPGGKTLHLAALMGNQGRIAAVESVRERFFRLRANLERGGAQMVRPYWMDGRAVGAKTPERFDRVLLDAPCSSEARFTRLDANSWAHWSPAKIREAARKQGRLLASASRALRPGGRLLYCTCSFAPEENELVLDRLLARDGAELRLLPIRQAMPPFQPGLTQWDGRALHPDLALSRRILPDAHVDGFFLALLEKAPRRA